MSRNRSWVALILAGATACSAGDPAVVELDFVFAERPVDDPATLFFTLRIEADGATLATAGPIHLAANASIETPQVPNGDARVAVAELRRLAWTNDQVLYFGTSEPFSIEPGDRVHETVTLVRGSPGAAPGDPGGSSWAPPWRSIRSCGKSSIFNS